VSKLPRKRIGRRIKRARVLGPDRAVIGWGGSDGTHETLICGHEVAVIKPNGVRCYPNSRRCSICLLQEMAE
jgi:hypothetical protein